MTDKKNNPDHKFIIPSHFSAKKVEASKQKQQFFAEGARVMGDVRLGIKISIWYNAVVRADVNYISIGDESNVQDGSILHVTNAKPCLIGKQVTIGHQVNLHGCMVENLCLIGIGAIVLTGAVIGKGSVVASGAVVKENEIVPPFTLMAGVPAKPIKKLSENIILNEHQNWAGKYIKLASLHQKKA